MISPRSRQELLLGVDIANVIFFMPDQPEHINVCVIRDNVWQATHQRRQSDN